MSSPADRAIAQIMTAAKRIVIEEDPETEDYLLMATAEWLDGSSTTITEDFMSHALDALAADSPNHVTSQETPPRRKCPRCGEPVLGDEDRLTTDFGTEHQRCHDNAAD